MSNQSCDSLPPLVSVPICSYNHEAFIEQSLQSVLAQEGCRLEILVGDDASTDNTQGIVSRLAKSARFPVRKLFRESNWGPQANHADLLENCQGKYIALLDGDDYWTDNLKLQKQVDFLEAHPECSACFHDAEIRDAEGRLVRNYVIGVKKLAYHLEDVIRENIIPTCSVVFRRQVLDQLPAWYLNGRLSLGDWPLHVFNAQRGSIGFLDEVMGVYRLHAGGVFSRGSLRDWPVETHISRHRSCLEFYEVIDQHLSYSQHATLLPLILREHFDLVWFHQQTGNWKDMRRHLWKGLKLGGIRTSISRIVMGKYLCIAHFPWLYQALRRAGK